MNAHEKLVQVQLQQSCAVISLPYCILEREIERIEIERLLQRIEIAYPLSILTTKFLPLFLQKYYVPTFRH